MNAADAFARWFSLDGYVAAPARPWRESELALGLAFVFAFVSTVLSSVPLTASAGSIVPVAVRNAALSNIASVVLNPLWLSGGGREVGGPMLGSGVAAAGNTRRRDGT